MKFEYGFFEYIDADSDNNEESNIRVCVNVSQIPQNIKNGCHVTAINTLLVHNGIIFCNNPRIEPVKLHFIRK